MADGYPIQNSNSRSKPDVIFDPDPPLQIEPLLRDRYISALRMVMTAANELGIGADNHIIAHTDSTLTNRMDN